jgi:SPP1 family predicted phage head-tail adaptor
MPSAGKLNRKVTIQSPSTTQDEYGAPTQVWTDLITTWAAIRAATSKEVYAASGFTSQLSHIITIRWRPGIQANQRIAYRGRTFEIQAVADPDESRVELNLLCLELNGPSA